MGVEVVEVVQRLHHVRGVVEHDDRPGPAHRPGGGQTVEVVRDVENAHLLLGKRAVGLAELEAELLSHAQDLRGGPTGDDRLEFAPLAEAAAEVLEDLAEGQRAVLDLEAAGLPHVARNANEAGAGIVRAPNLRVLGSSHANDVDHVAEGLDVIDDGRALVKSEDGGEEGGLDTRVGALALDRLDEPRLLAADVGTRPTVNVDLE